MKLETISLCAACLALLAPSSQAGKPIKAGPAAPEAAAPASARAKTDGEAATPSAASPGSDDDTAAPAKAKKKKPKAVSATKAASDGKETPPPPPAPKRTWLPDGIFAGNFTLGTMVSDERTGVYLDSITGLWANQARTSYVFLDTRYHYEDNSQFITSTGLGFRQRVPGHDVIFGVNAFWDAVNSEHDNDLNQLGLGVEVLTHWVDARFNYYLPEDDQFEVGSRTVRRSHSSFVPGGILKTDDRFEFKRFEAGLEGYNAEIGVLIPGLDRYAEVRAFAGFYHYDNPFGGDFDGFKARLEARLLRGVTAGVEYWDDKELMGGHWTGEVAVSLPFSFYNLFTGKNPFAGASESFRPVPRPFMDRMADPVVRSHRIQTVTSGDLPAGHSTSTHFTPVGNPSSGGGGGSSSSGSGGFPVE